MKKIFILVLLVVAVAGCGKNSAGDSQPSQDKAAVDLEAEIDRAFKEAGGHAPTVLELTANGWCEKTKGTVYENLVFATDGSMKRVFGTRYGDSDNQVIYGSYRLKDGHLTERIETVTRSAQLTIGTKDGGTILRLKRDGSRSLLYSACSQQ